MNATVNTPVSLTETRTLAEHWRQHGHEYTDERAAAVQQVTVRLSQSARLQQQPAAAEQAAPSSGFLTWPADRVWRVRYAPCTRGWSELHPPAEALVLDGGTEVCASLRDAFVARPGCVLLSADYRQVEMRLMAHFSEDDALLEALRGQKDLFTSIAASMFGITPARVTPSKRTRAKQVSYAAVRSNAGRLPATAHAPYLPPVRSPASGTRCSTARGRGS